MKSTNLKWVIFVLILIISLAGFIIFQHYKLSNTEYYSSGRIIETYEDKNMVEVNINDVKVQEYMYQI